MNRDVIALVVNLLGSVAAGWRRLILTITLAVLATGASVALMGVSAWLISFAAEHPPILYLQVAAVGVRFFGTARGPFRYAERLISHDLALRMQSGLRMRTYEQLSRTTLLGSRHGDLLVRVTGDVEGIMDVIVRVVLPFSSASIVLIGTSTILAFLNPVSSAILLVMSILAGVVMPLLSQRLSKVVDSDAVVARGELADRVHELARVAPELLVYQAAAAELERMHAVDSRLRKAERKAAWTHGLTAAGQQVAMGIAVIAALITGAELVADGGMLARNLAVICLTPLALHESFADLTKATQTLTKAENSLARVIALLTATPIGSGDRVITARSADEEPVQLVAADLSIGWPGETEIVRDIDFEVDAGEKVAIVGASGIGKTTLAATILGQIPPKSGELRVPGRISYLAQDAHIFTTTLSENVRIGNKDASPDEVAAALRAAGLSLDASRVVGEDGSTLSGGEARRVALARILVAGELPDLVILDEPTEHLDHETATSLMSDVLHTLAGVSVVMITHDPSVMAKADRVLHLTQSGITN